MSMSTHVVGIKTPNEQWRQMKAIWDICEKAKITPPGAVSDFFGDEPPDDAGVVVDLNDLEGVVEEYEADMQSGFVVNFEKLSKTCPGITHIRFYNSF